jgi:hypothetical protein
MTISRTSVETIFRAEDIEGFIEIHGTPDDEYDSEAEIISKALNELSEDRFTEDNIISIIIHVWAKMFNLDDDDIQKRMSAFQSVAQKILLLRNAS